VGWLATNKQKMHYKEMGALWVFRTITCHLPVKNGRESPWQTHSASAFLVILFQLNLLACRISSGRRASDKTWSDSQEVGTSEHSPALK
jgi:hypothetical protein